MTVTEQPDTTMVDPMRIRKNPRNPRRFFNDENLDLLRTSLQEVGVLVPLIVFETPGEPGTFTLMDGERRWSSALDIGLEEVPVRRIPAPSPLENLLRMFNIHSVREGWPLISTALSLRDIMRISGETSEPRLAEMTGLTRSTVRRAKRLLRIPDAELDRIQSEAHLPREEQVHREDLYLEIEAAESVLRNRVPEAMADFERDFVFRQFAMKRENDTLVAVTDFRYVGRLVKAIDDELLTREEVNDAVRRLVLDVDVSPRDLFDEVAAEAYAQRSLARKAELLAADVSDLAGRSLSHDLRQRLSALREVLDAFLQGP